MPLFDFSVLSILLSIITGDQISWCPAEISPDNPRYPNDMAKQELFKKLLQGSVVAVVFFVTADQV